MVKKGDALPGVSFGTVDAQLGRAVLANNLLSAIELRWGDARQLEPAQTVPRRKSPAHPDAWAATPQEPPSAPCAHPDRMPTRQVWWLRDYVLVFLAGRKESFDDLCFFLFNWFANDSVNVH
jgi:hypothetical protein